MVTDDARTRRLRALPRYSQSSLDDLLLRDPDGDWVRFSDVEAVLDTEGDRQTPRAIENMHDCINCSEEGAKQWANPHVGPFCDDCYRWLRADTEGEPVATRLSSQDEARESFLRGHLDTEGDRPEPDDANELRTVVRDMRLSAIDRLCADVPKLWPRLSARTFAAVVGALGEISIIEAREALSRADTEGA